ncbi:hypothetical protein OHB00_34155 [Streptomyces sp. NBC_00631]|uniref:hypothetical protein n=1 Tax=Streptomyces sp. NBC_00631 TaxID=2975793 RepID=UPI0030E2D22E
MRSNPAVTCCEAIKINTPLQRDHWQTAASGGIRLHNNKTPHSANTLQDVAVDCQ